MIIDKDGNEWFGHEIQTKPEEEAKVYDPEQGDNALVRSFRIVTDPTKDSAPEEVLNFHKQSVLDNLFTSGWELVRELTIISIETKGAFDIVAICKPARKHGSIQGVTNNEAKNVSEGFAKEELAKKKKK